MPPELEDRVRSALRSIPDPRDEVGARLRAAALDGVAPSRRRSIGRIGRRVLRPLPAIGAVVAVGAILVALVIATPSDEPATPPATTGVELVLRAVPYAPGVSAEAETDRLADVLRRRGEIRGVTGMTVTVEDGRVHLFVPRTHDTAWPRQALLNGLDVAIYDTSTSVLVSDRDLGKVLAALPQPAAGDAVHYYVVSPTGSPQTSYVAGPFADEGAARAVNLDHIAGRPRVVGLPADVALVLTNAPIAAARGPFAFAGLRGPLAGPEEIAGVRADGNRLLVEIVPAARERVARDAPTARTASRTLLIGFGGGGIPQTLSQFQYDGYDAAAGELLFRIAVRNRFETSAAASTARDLGSGGVDAGVIVESEGTVGPPPARLGEPVVAADAPAVFRRMSRGHFADDPFRPAPGSIVHVLDADWKGKPMSMWTYVAANGSELLTTIGPNGTEAATGGCPIAPDFPVIYVCVGGWSGAGSPSYAGGRVGEGVTSITAEYADGTHRDATVANGFFLLLQERSNDSPTELVARDASGAVVGTLVPGTAGIPPIGITTP